jgi:guanine deaminase
MDKEYLLQAIELARKNKNEGGRPFGAVLVKDGKVLATGVNGMNKNHDVSSHAELEAIRSATQNLGDINLEGSIIYASGHPCPMCLAAIFMTNIKSVFYAFDNTDAEPYGISSDLTYKKLGIIKEKIPLPIIRLDVGVTADELYK